MNEVTVGDCREHLPMLEDSSVDLLLSDIPYGTNSANWDVLHRNTNSALLGQSPAQQGKPLFKRRGKPINGWSQADRRSGKEYEDWCRSWARLVTPKMKDGASLLVFGGRRTIHHVINAFEDSGFLLKDMLAWKKPVAPVRAQRISVVFSRRGLEDDASKWRGWRVGNLSPVFEPIAWLVKPYRIGGTIADNVLEHGVGAINFGACSAAPTNVLEFGFSRGETRVHQAQKPVGLMEFLIRLTTLENQLVLDPFLGSGTTAVAALRLGRRFVGMEADPDSALLSQNRIAAVPRRSPSGEPSQCQMVLDDLG